MDNILHWQDGLADDARQFFSQHEHSANANPWHRDILERYLQFSLSGKLLRGCLVCFAHEAFGGTKPAAARQAAIGLEIIHSGLLVHDDIIDQDELRRGQPAVHRQYQALAPKGSSNHFGTSMAICAADAAFFLAFEQIGNTKLSPDTNQRLIRAFSKAFMSVCAGQMLDIDLGNRLGSRKDVLDKQSIMLMMQQKTATYSVALPLMAGAIIAGTAEDTITKLEQLGLLIGTVYQIRDDELGVFGNPAKTGKPAGADITEGKKTLLYYWLMKRATSAQKKRAQTIFGNKDATEDDITFIRQLMLTCDVPAALEHEIEILNREARGLINGLSISRTGHSDLLELMKFCAKRDL